MTEVGVGKWRARFCGAMEEERRRAQTSRHFVQVAFIFRGTTRLENPRVNLVSSLDSCDFGRD